MTEDDRNGGTDPQAVQPARKRGRPPKGDPLVVRLDAQERKVADGLGDGVAAEGVRIALMAAARMGVQATRLLAFGGDPKSKAGDK